MTRYTHFRQGKRGKLTPEGTNSLSERDNVYKTPVSKSIKGKNPPNS